MRLRRVHALGHVQRGQAGVGDLHAGQELGDDAGHQPAGGQRRVGHRAHQPDAAAAVDQAYSLGGQPGAKRGCRVQRRGVMAGA